MIRVHQAAAVVVDCPPFTARIELCVDLSGKQSASILHDGEKDKGHDLYCN